MTNAQTTAAKTFGAIAFANGVRCAPVLCKNMMEMLSGREVGDKRTTQEMKAWIAGWMQANLAA